LNKRCADSPAASNRLLTRDDPPPVIVTNPSGSSPFLLLGDHAGRAIPIHLGDLGLPPSAMDRHIAWDIGVAGLGQLLAQRLDAGFIRQSYSRLVIDCNRKPGAADWTPAACDGQAVSGNTGLSVGDLAARRRAIYDPYQAAISAALDARERLGRATFLVSLHSFTPELGGVLRPWRFGVLHRGDSPLSSHVLDLLRNAFGEEAGDNQPYAMDDSDNTVPLHADPRGLDYLELEVRQDLLLGSAGQDATAGFVAKLLGKALESLASHAD
jgi:predicted N-formylglutamate amidohydrolase